jgi:hypothetical protein
MDNKKCPFFRKGCMKHECMFWTHLIGMNPQTGQDIDKFDCAISILPMLLVENAKNVSQAQAAVEDFRDKSTKFEDKLIGGLRAMTLIGQNKEEQKKQIKESDIIDVDINDES